MAIQVDMVGIVVSNMAAALRFYRMLGLTIGDSMDTENHVEVITANGYRLAWDTEELIKSIEPGWVQPAGHRMGLAFKCDSPAEVDAAYHKLVAAGYESRKEPWDAFWGQRYALVSDPDGNPVDLFAPL
jgi:uncharacterized glyoxalase superfamily protein PhnB